MSGKRNATARCRLPRLLRPALPISYAGGNRREIPMPKRDERAQYTDEDYRLIALRHLDRLTQDRNGARQALWDQSRLLVLLLFIANGGGVTLLLAQPLQASDAQPEWWFLTGLVLSIVAAFATWVQ